MRPQANATTRCGGVRWPGAHGRDGARPSKSPGNMSARSRSRGDMRAGCPHDAP